MNFTELRMKSIIFELSFLERLGKILQYLVIFNVRTSKIFSLTVDFFSSTGICKRSRQIFISSLKKSSSIFLFLKIILRSKFKSLIKAFRIFSVSTLIISLVFICSSISLILSGEFSSCTVFFFGLPFSFILPTLHLDLIFISFFFSLICDR